MFAALVAIKLLALFALGEAAPLGRNADVNVYLEMALHAWRDGYVGSRVTGSYPPVYPLAIAPAFGIASNALRFDAIYALHALWLALGCALWVPALRARLGTVAAWGVAGAMQLGGAALIAGYNPQSEALYLPLVVALGGVLASGADGRRWAAAGLLAGLAVGTRRMGLATVVGVAAASIGDRRALWALPGFAAGCLPEVVASRFGGGVDAYWGSPASDHLKAGGEALASGEGAWLLVRAVARHAAFSLATTFGAPLVLALAWKERVSRFALAAWAATIGMAALHIVRFQIRTGEEGWDLYPRYLDPLEPMLVLAAVVVGAARRSRALLAAGLGLVALSAPLGRVRGGRMLAESWGGDAVAAWLWPALAAAVVVGSWWAARGSRASRALVVGSLVVSVGLSAPSLRKRLREPAPLPSLLQGGTVAQTPERPLLVVVQEPGPYGRKYHEPAFRSDHVVRWIAEDEIEGWLVREPDAWVLTHKDDEPPLGLEKVGRRSRWRIYQRVSGRDPGEP